MECNCFSIVSLTGLTVRTAAYEVLGVWQQSGNYLQTGLWEMKKYAGHSDV